MRKKQLPSKSCHLQNFGTGWLTHPHSKYGGFPRPMIDRFVNMGFDIERVVEAFSYYQINANNGQDYELEEAYMGDITARLLGES